MRVRGVGAALGDLSMASHTPNPLWSHSPNASGTGALTPCYAKARRAWQQGLRVLAFIEDVATAAGASTWQRGERWCVGVWWAP